MACCLAVAIAQMCITIPSPINGDITAAFGSSGSQVAWVTSAFILPTAILELNFGVVGDLFGRKRLLVLGGLILAVGELVDATAQNIQSLWIGQAIAGVGAAALFPSTLAVLAAATPDTKERARALSTWALSISLASAIGPLQSGILGTYADWRYAFVPAAVIGVISSVVCLRYVTDSRAPEGRSLDWPGQITVAVALTALLWAIIEGGDLGWGSVPIVGCFVVGVLALAAFVLVELRSRTPMMNLSLLRIPSFAGAAGVALVGMLGFIGTAYCVSIRLGAVMHLNALAAGMPFVVLQLIPLLMAPVLSRLLGGVSPRRLLLAGLLPMAAGQFWLAALPITTTSLAAFLGPVLLLGVGFIFVISSLTAAAVNSVPPELTGMASGATSLVREFGQALGPAVISSVAMGLAGDALIGKLSGAAAAINAAGGPLAVVNVPAAGAAAQLAARDALEHGLAVGVTICGVASLVGAAIVLSVVRSTAAPETAGSRPVEEPALA